ncbi:MAG: FkbM family methyltransferase [Panacagrimonas sp.]
MSAQRVRHALRNSAKEFFRTVGFDIVRLKNSPEVTLAGLRDRPIKTVIDCGANEGQFARKISKYHPNAALYCFEPLETPFRALSAWANTQNGRVKCSQVALGDQEGEAVMHFHEEHSPSSSLLATTGHKESMFPQVRKQSEVRVRQTTLDAAMTPVLNEMAPQIVLKLDVQGYEDRVLRGASQLLPKVNACLLEVCVDPLYSAQAAFKDLVMLLDHHGLSYAGNLDQSYGEDGRVMWLDALFVR